ncbi:MAG TPA: pyridoxal phosphate-dependent aminotransferase [Thermoanaerobaculia bacterium]|nr:pyridoxal phosphate-dependent aminotransferase [Thermoanaerobaculia bacterium]
MAPRQPETGNRQRFSRRTNWNPKSNRIAVARQERGDALIDLTESNPTRAGIDYPLDELSETLARAARASYTPDPRGLASAREALGGGDILLTASTSEAYAFLFKLLCDPGDEVITATPSYPLFEHLAALESVALRNFQMEFHRRWEIDTARIALTSRTRAIVAVHPNNPTGSFVTPSEQEALARFGLPIISDEVFLDYPLEGAGGTFRPDTLTFTLGGLSKSAGLPHYKLGWIRVGGPGAKEAIEALELIADNFLSVATPVQAAVPELLRIAPRIRASISQRTKRNLAHLRANAGASTTVLPVEGGWSAVLRVPRVESDEDLAVRLIAQHGVVVHPGYFFDFDSDGYIVVSLLTQPSQFDEGVRRLFEALPR